MSNYGSFMPFYVGSRRWEAYVRYHNPSLPKILRFSEGNLPQTTDLCCRLETGNGILFTGSRRSEGNIFVMAESEIFSHPVRPDLCGHFVIWQSLS